MCAAKKNEEKELTIGGILMSAVLMALVGMVLGFAFLVSFPLKVFSSAKDEADFLEKTEMVAPIPGSIYYFKGPQLRGSGWEQKRGQFLSGEVTSVSMTDGELNSWAAANFRKPSASSVEEEPSVLILPGVPNFFALDSDSFYVSIPTEIVLLGHSDNYIFVAKGHFSEGLTVKYVIDELHVNNASIPVVGGIANKVMAILIRAYSGLEEVNSIGTAWERLESVELEANVIRFKLR